MKYWLLRNSNDNKSYPIFEIDIKVLDEYFCDFTIYQANGWSIDYEDIYDKSFVSEVHFKADFCTHWWFYGEDYDEECDRDVKDSYYHICSRITDWQIMFSFVRKLMYQLLGDKQNWYTDEDKEIDNFLLKNYSIIKRE